VHAWLDRYREGGLAGLVTRSSRPSSCPHQTDVEVEQRICELRRAHPRWGPRRLGFELERRGVSRPPSRETVYRILVRNGLLEPKTRRKRRSAYLRWERAVPMELWQLDIVGGVILADAPEAKVVTGVDDHSRFCVIASAAGGDDQGMGLPVALPRVSPYSPARAPCRTSRFGRTSSSGMASGPWSRSTGATSPGRR
jgi:transposase InsO family protein